MVDFDSAQTVGIPASEISKIVVLQRRYDLTEAYEDYRKKQIMGVASNVSVVRARLLTLFIELSGTLKRQLTAQQFEGLQHTCLNSEEETEIFDTIIFFNDFLDKLRLTRFDTQQVYESTNIEAENLVKGY